MAEESWISRWKAVHCYFARHMQKSIDLIRRVRSTVEAVILLLASRPSSFNSNCLPLGHSHFPYQENKINKWFVQGIRSQNTGEQRSVNVMNVNREGRRSGFYRTQNQAAFPNSLSHDQFEVLCHGTNHRSAQNIMERGIDFSKSCKGVPQDFSDGDGYYVSNNFDEILKFAQDETRSREGQAVLVYRVSTGELRGKKKDENGLELCDNRSEEWLEVVREYRRPYSRNPRFRINKNLRKEWAKLYFIEGPITSGSKNPPSTDYNDDSHQLCVRNQICAQLFNISLHSVVFFEG